MAKNGAFIPAAAKVHPKWRTPWFAIALSGRLFDAHDDDAVRPDLIVYIGFLLNFFMCCRRQPVQVPPTRGLAEGRRGELRLPPHSADFCDSSTVDDRFRGDPETCDRHRRGPDSCFWRCVLPFAISEVSWLRCLTARSQRRHCCGAKTACRGAGGARPPARVGRGPGRSRSGVGDLRSEQSPDLRGTRDLQREDHAPGFDHDAELLNLIDGLNQPPGDRRNPCADAAASASRFAPHPVGHRSVEGRRWVPPV